MTGICSRTLGLVLGASCLAGCATNAIRLDRAETMVAAGRTASEATAALLERTREANREVLIDLVAEDPACSLRRPVIAAAADQRTPGFCRRGAVPGQDGAFELRRIVPADFKPTLAVIAALAGYLDEVDAVLTRDAVDIGADLAAAESDLRVILGAARAAAEGTSALPALTADQQAAVNGALALLSTIIDERGRVADLRRIESPENRRVFAETLAALRMANKLWLDKYEGQLSNRQTLLDAKLNRLAGASPERRRPEAAALLAVIEEREIAPRLRATLVEVSNSLEASHQAYVDLLDNGNAPLTEKERRRKAKLNHDRVIGALRSLTALIEAF